MSTADDRPTDAPRGEEHPRHESDEAHRSAGDPDATVVVGRPTSPQDDATRPLEPVDDPGDRPPSQETVEVQRDDRPPVSGPPGRPPAQPPTGLPPVPPRPSERPVTDPYGPGTTFFTNHPDDVAAREKEAYGGVHVGSAFFGWLVAVGLSALLLGLLSVVGVVFGAAVGGQDLNEVLEAVDLGTAGVVAAVGVGLALFLAYLGGGYVAGRMARFDGLKQGLAVWLWALVISVVVGVVGYLAGERFDLLAQVDTLGLPSVAGDLTTAGAVAVGVVLLVTLLGSLAGGALGTRYHRKVDRVGLLEDPAADR